MEPYKSSLEHVLAELERIDLLIRVQVERARGTLQDQGELQGLYISEQELDALLAEPAGLPRWAAVPHRPEVVEALGRLAQGIGERKAEATVELRLEELARRFELTPFDLDALLVTLAPEVDLRYERLFAYLQDDVTKRRPSFDLVLNLLCPTFEAKLASRSRFSGQAPLLRHRLVEPFDDPSRPQPPLLARYLRADARVAAWLFGDDGIDGRLAPYARRVEPAARLEEIVQEPALKERLLALAGQEGNRVLYLQGPFGVGKETTAEALCRELGVLLLTVDLERLLAAPEDTFETAVELAGREAVLQGAALFWNGFDLLLADDKAGRRGRFLAALEALKEYRGLTFLAGESGWEPSDALHGTAFTRVELPVPGHSERLELWLRALPEAKTLDLDSIAAKFRFTAGRIRDSAATARSLARARDPQGGTITEADLYAACRLQSSQKLATLAQKIVPRYRWDDIVLPAGRMEQLREICNMLRFRSRVYEDWGFGGKLAMGKGLNVLFSGPSGTGKTMAAEILGSDLGLDLYKIDLSTVISKYIGETEKNLSRIFDEGRASNAILFFDEADAVFGKRTEVKDAHDRYANIEVSYLLQRMEEYEGMVILASNLRKNMDEAFVRRLHFTIEFPFPAENDRRRIWDGLWPAALPRSTDLDLDFMARRFEIPGGNIRNIALASAFLAASDGGVVTMAHLIRATQREYQKMGKVVLSGEFGEYEGLTEAR
ncbi:MAG TPA: AAA family ATPase [Thermoanaerobaculia bacterium]|nr:AAA family ATPase [Thermoanaerobaculia bacterium]